MLPLSLSSTLNPLLWSRSDAIINAHDPMQHLGQTRIIYKPGQTRLIRTKCDLENPTRFQPWNTYTHTSLHTHTNIHTHTYKRNTHTHTHTHIQMYTHTIHVYTHWHVQTYIHTMLSCFYSTNNMERLKINTYCQDDFSRFRMIERPTRECYSLSGNLQW